MAHCERASRPLIQCLHKSSIRGLSSVQLQTTRTFQTTTIVRDEAQPEAARVPFYKAPDPTLVSSPRLERRLIRQGILPVGSRRRRAALQDTPGIPFEELPYQCFQEARKVLLADREEKLKDITATSEKIARLQALPEEEQKNGSIKSRLGALERHLEKLKVLADINDPLVKKRFEDGLGDMSKPIYRHLADQKWREYRRKIIVQRITQMKVIPDVLPYCDPVVDVKLYFNRKAVQPGEFVDSLVSTNVPKLDVQMFDGGEKLVTIAVVDSDVPNVLEDKFDYKMHYFAVNVPLSAVNNKIDLAALSTDSQVVLPWLPPVAQKGSPYHRLSMFVLEQKNSKPLDFASIKARETDRDNLLLRTLQARYRLKPIGAHLFRTIFDENTLEVMKQTGFADAEFELRRKKSEALPYKRRNTLRMRG
ncbi:phosphatidylethanolamine-binding protein [Aspergillus karnatakaensis]|uniref:mitochondrial 54S ribosomal protein mL38 n=1 Tax=Aspergillus karnatakaensis TaxID=1810916 RepID=UPI003CCDA121